MALELKMSELIKQLNDATLAYEKGQPIMSDGEWDNLYFILQKMEMETGIILPNSPTQNIIFEIKTKLEKKEHNHKMLSLDKTKDIEVVKAFIKNQPCIVMSKMDGLTCSLHYKDGYLVSAETRGDGLVGEDVTHNARVIQNIPNRIATNIELVIDGEIICAYDKFDQFNAEYRNPRNFAAGSIRLLNSTECFNRGLSFVAWDVIQGMDEIELLSERLKSLYTLGFTIVPFIVSNHGVDEHLIEAIKTLSSANQYPIDGVVFKFDNIEYGKQQGETSHHFKNAIAYKFYDEAVSTKLKDIEWTMGRTGTLTPVAIFEPVELEGTTVERANLHNISVLKSTLGAYPWVGQKIDVFKANMIIPQIENAEKCDDINQLPGEQIQFPKICPVCGEPTQIVLSNTGVINMICTNPACEGKLINKLDHMCGKKGLDIKGLSKATLEKLISWGWLNKPVDIYYLKDHKQDWINMAGFGVKSVEKILTAIEESRNTTLEAFISSIGIPMIGHTLAKQLVKFVPSYDDFRDMIDDGYDFSDHDGFGIEKRDAILKFNYEDADEVYKELNIAGPAAAGESDLKLEGKTFVITGRLKEFKNRDALVSKIESLGGKVNSSVSSNTNYLINNDTASTSSKNISAQKLGIPIISEQEFLKMFDIK